MRGSRIIVITVVVLAATLSGAVARARHGRDETLTGSAESVGDANAASPPT